ncbi:hypothetical protein V6Z11_A12G224300 [Gossypium hirsutum]
MKRKEKKGGEKEERRGEGDGASARGPVTGPSPDPRRRWRRPPYTMAEKGYGGARHAGMVLAEAWGVVADMVVTRDGASVKGKWGG